MAQAHGQTAARAEFRGSFKFEDCLVRPSHRRVHGPTPFMHPGTFYGAV